METLLNQFGLTSGELTQILTLIVILIVGLFILRVMFKLTAALLRMGCLIAALIVAAYLAFTFFNGT